MRPVTKRHSRRRLVLRVQKGVMIGRYILRDLLVESPRHRVFMARGLAGGRMVEIKVMQPQHRLQLMRSGQLANPYVRELRLAGEAHSACIVRHLDAGTTGTGEHYLVRQWVDGATVRDELAAEVRFELPKAVSIIADAAAAVEKMHHMGYVQRDLRPEILLVREATGPSQALHCLVIDLEAACRIGSCGLTFGEEHLVADPLYMAPEIARGEPVGPVTDVFALGALFYELLSGRPAMLGTGASSAERLSFLQSDAPIPIESLGVRLPDLPADTDLLVRKCMRREPDRRPSGIDQFLRGVNHVLKDYASRHGDDDIPKDLWPRLVR